jgi:hypothetical protein
MKCNLSLKDSRRSGGAKSENTYPRICKSFCSCESSKLHHARRKSSHSKARASLSLALSTTHFTGSGPVRSPFSSTVLRQSSYQVTRVLVITCGSTLHEQSPRVASQTSSDRKIPPISLSVNILRDLNHSHTNFARIVFLHAGCTLDNLDTIQ